MKQRKPGSWKRMRRLEGFHWPGGVYPVFIIAHTMMARANAPRITYVMMSALPGMVSPLELIPLKKKAPPFFKDGAQSNSAIFISCSE
jgi:hypothetical protein